MTSVRGGIAWAAIAFACVAGCGGDDGAPEGPFAPGISGGELAGRLEVIVVGEDTRSLISGARVDVRAGEARVIAERTPGWVVLEDARLAGSVTIEVLTEGVHAGRTTWVGVAGERVVIPVARAEGSRALEGRVVGADTLGAASVLAGPLVEPHIARPSALDAASPSTCVDDGGGACRFRASAPDDVQRAAAIVRDTSGAAIAFGIGAVAADDSVVLSLLDPAARIAAVPLAMEGPLPLPPVGLDAVVGVPGIATPSGIALLPQTASEGGALAVPELTGALADASWWVMGIAYAAADEDAARSVVLVRHLTDPARVGRLPEFLPVPEVTRGADGLALAPVAGATLAIVECEGEGGRHEITLVLDGATGPLGASCEAAIRVRAVDASGATGRALDLDAVERTAMRFSEVRVVD